MLYAALGHGPDARFWLDAGVHADSGLSYLGPASTVMTATAAGEVAWHPSGAVEQSPVLDVLRRDLASQAVPLLGWVGWLGYGLAEQTTVLTVSAGSRYPDAAFLRVDRMIMVDHAARTVDLVAADQDADVARAWFAEIEVAIEAAGRAPSPLRVDGRLGDAVWQDSDKRYLEAIDECQRAISDGEAYQLCLTTEIAVEGEIDPVAVWLALRESSPSHHGGIVELGRFGGRTQPTLVSSSPESFLQVEPDATVRSSPIKGTRPRSDDAALDRALADELRASVKERAENLMIVDLMRNDLGKVCEVGTVSVPALFEVQSYAQVHQLVSRVEGRLAPDRHPLDAVGACFPAGSMTGAPKLSAMSLLDRIESRPRGVYAGAFGYLGVDGSIDLAMVIRSIMIDERGATIGTGGGITALSEPVEELAEVKLKASALLAALGAH